MTDDELAAAALRAVKDPRYAHVYTAILVAYAAMADDEFPVTVGLVCRTVGTGELVDISAHIGATSHDAHRALIGDTDEAREAMREFDAAHVTHLPRIPDTPEGLTP